MTDHIHHWILARDTVSNVPGECACGAVRTFAGGVPYSIDRPFSVRGKQFKPGNAAHCFPHGTRLIPAHSEPVTRFGVPVLKKKQDEIWTALNFQVSDRQVEIAVSGGPLTKAEIGLIKDYLAVQERIAPSEREPCPL